MSTHTGIYLILPSPHQGITKLAQKHHIILMYRKHSDFYILYPDPTAAPRESNPIQSGPAPVLTTNKPSQAKTAQYTKKEQKINSKLAPKHTRT